MAREESEESTAKLTAEHEVSDHEAAEHEASEHEASEHEEAEPEAAEHEATEHEAEKGNADDESSEDASRDPDAVNEDVLVHAREILRKSQLLKNMCSHVSATVELELLVRKIFMEDEEWMVVDEMERNPEKQLRNETYDAMESKRFRQNTYRFVFEGCGPIDFPRKKKRTNEEEEKEEDKAPSTIIVLVKLVGDLAQVTIQFVEVSHDDGFNEMVVESYMCSARTGVHCEKHEVPPTIDQFEKCLRKCLEYLRLPSWALPYKEETTREEERSQEKTKAKKRSRS